MKKDLRKFLVEPGFTLRQVIQKIDQNGQGVALVAGDDQILQGIVTDGDIRRAILAGVALDLPIMNIMNSSFTAVPQLYKPEQIVALTSKRSYRHIPVIDPAGRAVDLLVTDEIQRLLQSPSSLFTPKVNFHKRILVVGGAGYIGSVLVRQLLEKGYAVKVLDKLIFGAASLQAVQTHPSFILVEGDTGHLGTVITAIKDVDVVVHLAEIVGDPACALDPEKTQQMNYLSTALIASVCKHFQINRFIYASSCSVYGAGEDFPLLTEKSPVNPVSLYARMKIESERALLNMADGFFSPTILRLATVFGVSPRMRFDLVVNTLTMKAVRDHQITLFGGEQWRPNVHVSDVARAVILVLEAPLAQVGGEVFNVGSNENNFTINQIANLVKEVVPSASLVYQNKEVDLRNYRVDFIKIQHLLGFTAQVTLQQGIVETAQAFSQGFFQDHADSVYYNDRWYGDQNRR